MIETLRIDRHLNGSEVWSVILHIKRRAEKVQEGVEESRKRYVGWKVVQESAVPPKCVGVAPSGGGRRRELMAKQEKGP